MPNIFQNEEQTEEVQKEATNLMGILEKRLLFILLNLVKATMPTAKKGSVFSTYKNTRSEMENPLIVMLS